MSLNSYLLNMMFPFSVCGCGLASPCARVKAALPRRRCSCPVSDRIRLGLHWFHLLLNCQQTGSDSCGEAMTVLGGEENTVLSVG